MFGTIVGGSGAAAKSNACVAANGEVRMQHGTATCAASGTGSVAIVHRDGSAARLPRAPSWRPVCLVR